MYCDGIHYPNKLCIKEVSTMIEVTGELTSAPRRKQISNFQRVFE